MSKEDETWVIIKQAGMGLENYIKCCIAILKKKKHNTDIITTF